MLPKSQVAEVTVGSAAEARAAGRRMYAEALRSKERLDAKRQEQQDLEALEELQRVPWFEPEIVIRFPLGKKPEYFQHETSTGVITAMMNSFAMVASTDIIKAPILGVSNNVNVMVSTGFHSIKLCLGW